MLDWARQGLMAVFFFVLGLEIKYEVTRGELANPRHLLLPAVAWSRRGGAASTSG